MKVLFESTQFLYGTRAIRRYVVQLASNMPVSAPDDEFVFFYRFYRYSSYGKPPEPQAKNATNITVRFPGKLIRFSWRVFKRPRIDLYSKDIDLVHFPGSFLTPAKTRNIILTLHGLAPLVIPDLIRSSYVSEIKAALDESVKRNSYYLAVSETTRKEFLERFDVKPDKVGVTPLGVDDSFRPLEKDVTAAVLKQKFDIDFPYILYVGGVQANKNISGILKSFAIATSRGLDVHLVLAGDLVQEPPEIRQLLRDFGIEKSVHFLGYIKQDSDDLPILYSQAEVFLFPTFYEGWTSPPLEAMKCGTPVVTSNVSSLHETCGDAALLADPNDHEEIAEKIIMTMQDNALRKDLIEKGKKHAAQFTWKKCAKKTIEFYRKVMGK